MPTSQSTLFIIPARGGSKGVPGKNLRAIGGVPLVARAVRTAKRVVAALPAGDHLVLCSTDDEAIAAVAREWGAAVPFLRPAELARDDSPTMDAIVHVLAQFDPNRFHVVVVLQPTSPLSEPQDVLGAIALHTKTGAPVVSVCETAHPAAWQFGLDAEGRLQPVIAGDRPARRQDAKPTVQLNGAVYVASREHLVSGGGFLCAETRGFEMPAGRSMDIDTAQDLVVAEAVLASREPALIQIGDREIGAGKPCFIIAEAGVNHNGDLATALRLVDAAVAAGADAVKFQTFDAARLAGPRAPKAAYQKRTTGSEESQLDMLRRLELSGDAHRRIVEHCRQRRILFLSSPFDEESADFLEGLDVAAFKIPSGEITNLPFLAHVAAKRRPIIMSTGMSSLREVDTAVRTVRASGGADLVLLHCVSSYPAPVADVNLRAMQTMARAFDVCVGYSDHTEGDVAALASVALGAVLIEKHFTLDRSMSGPDHQASIEPGELASLVARIRTVELVMGHGRKEVSASEADSRAVGRKSLVAVSRIPSGAVIERSMLTARRPGSGISPSQIDEVIGRRARNEIDAGALIEWRCFE